MTIGRPTLFSEQLADSICAQIADGKSLRTICAQEGMPEKKTVFRWLEKDENAAFRHQYARARELQADALFDEILDIADDGRNDTYIAENGEGRINHEAVARARLRVDARKWYASKLAPKKYGEALALHHGGSIALSIAEQIKQAHAERAG